MNDFKTLGIKVSENKSFIGDKVSINKVLNRPIIVHRHEIKPSKFKEGKCLHIQITLNDAKRVVFTASTYLIDMIEQVLKMHFHLLQLLLKTMNDSLLPKLNKNNILKTPTQKLGFFISHQFVIGSL